LFFAATDEINGTELWRSDGTVTGTTLVKDIVPGNASSNPNYLTNVSDRLYFTASADGIIGELWSSNQTGVLRPLRLALGSNPLNFTDVKGTVFFLALDPSHGQELWRSNGATAGTALVKDINPGPANSSPEYLTNVNGTLFFAADNGVSGRELWRSDGTAPGTLLIKDIRPGSLSSFPGPLTNVNGTLFFAANNGTSGSELWRSDGTAAGTVLVKDIRPGGTGSSPYGHSEAANINGTFFFVANNGVSGGELWKSNGTAAGTVLIKDIRPGIADSYIQEMTNVNGTMFFSAKVDSNRAELWKSDGTGVGTRVVKIINPDTGSENGSQPLFLTNMNGTLFFGANNGTSGQELWKSDGSAPGTVLVKDIDPGSDGSEPYSITNVNGTLFFQARNGVSGFELWKSNGSAAGTALVKDINPGSGASYPSLLTNVNGTLFFSATNGVSGFELWRSNGAANGTTLTLDIQPGPNDSIRDILTNAGGILFFRADDGTHGLEPWIVKTGAATQTVANTGAAIVGSPPDTPDAASPLRAKPKGVINEAFSRALLAPVAVIPFLRNEEPVSAEDRVQGEQGAYLRQELRDGDSAFERESSPLAVAVEDAAFAELLSQDLVLSRQSADRSQLWSHRLTRL
jgi:ELWxxDGT repeat protein